MLDQIWRDFGLRSLLRRYGNDRRFKFDLERAAFAMVASRLIEPSCSTQEQLNLLHSGILYPHDRDPSLFFAALAALARRGVVSPNTLRVTLRASGHDEVLRAMIERAGVADLVRLEPAIPYTEALAEMMAADGLLIFQAASCNHQIPAKLLQPMILFLLKRRQVTFGGMKNNADWLGSVLYGFRAARRRIHMEARARTIGDQKAEFDAKAVAVNVSGF